jgi:CRISPR-associated protein Csb2
MKKKMGKVKSQPKQKNNPKMLGHITMTYSLLISVRLLHDRYHGCKPTRELEDWPPSPFRLFQALLSGARLGRWYSHWRDDVDGDAFRWLETQRAPLIITPPVRKGQFVQYYMPNNDGDLVLSGNISKEKSRTGKRVQPWLVNDGLIHYIWPISEELWDKSGPQIKRLAELTERMYQFGRCIDAACAEGRIVKTDEIHSLDGDVYYPDETRSGDSLIPVAGALDQLIVRFNAFQHRLKQIRNYGPVTAVRRICYHHSTVPTKQVTFTLHDPNNDNRFATLPVLYSAIFTASVRNELASGLCHTLEQYPQHAGYSQAEVEKLVLGRDAVQADKSLRLLFLALPSIGHAYADGAVRRLMITVPSSSPFSGDLIIRLLDGKIIHAEMCDLNHLSVRLKSIDEAGLPLDSMEAEERMKIRFVPKMGGKVWRSITPVILPGHVKIHRPNVNDPLSVFQADQMRRSCMFDLAVKAIQNAGLDPKKTTVTKLQLEPFRSRDVRADAEWHLPKSQKTGKAWLSDRPRVHLELSMSEAFSGPLVIGDGRFLGLGLFATEGNPGERNAKKKFEYRNIHHSVVSDSTFTAALFSLGTTKHQQNFPSITQTLPHADLFHRALAKHATYRGGGCPVLTGCDESRRPLKGHHDHAHILPLDIDRDGYLDHVMIWAPIGMDAKAQMILHDMRRLYTKGRLSYIDLTLVQSGCLEDFRNISDAYGENIQAVLGPHDGILEWTSLTPFVPPRHMKKNGHNSLEGQVLAELRSRGFPEAASVKQIHFENDRSLMRQKDFIRRRLFGPPPPIDCGFSIRIRFAEPVTGPLCLGYGSHFGLGLFTSSTSN